MGSAEGEHLAEALEEEAADHLDAAPCGHTRQARMSQHEQLCGTG
jgi:hypothetical protein